MEYSGKTISGLKVNGVYAEENPVYPIVSFGKILIDNLKKGENVVEMCFSNNYTTMNHKYVVGLHSVMEKGDEQDL